MSIRIRRDMVFNESVYFIIGVDDIGHREVLDFYIGATESSEMWKEILYNLKERGVEQVLLGVMDGLPGIENTFLNVFPKADIQRCITRLIRKKDVQQFTEELKSVYKADSLEKAKIALDEVSTIWSKRYPKVMERWTKNPYILTYYKYPKLIRKVIYTTNWIERFNKEVLHLK